MIAAWECIQAAMDHWYKKSEFLYPLRLTDLCDRIYTRADPKLLEVYERCVDCREEVRLYFDLEVSPNESPVRVINKLLRTLHGFDVVQIGTVGPNGSQLHVYQVGDCRSQTRKNIFDAWNQKVSRHKRQNRYR